MNQHISLGGDPLSNRGGNGYYWSGTEYDSSDAWGAYFGSFNASASGWNDKFVGFPVRLFASE